jgi:hypothetical protein
MGRMLLELGIRYWMLDTRYWMEKIYSPLEKSLSRNCGRIRGVLDMRYMIRDIILIASRGDGLRVARHGSAGLRNTP